MNFQVAPKEHYHLCWEPLLWRFGEEGDVVYLLPALLPLHSCCDGAGRRGWEYLSWQGRSSFMLVPATDRLTGYMLSVVGQNCPLSISSKHWGNFVWLEDNCFRLIPSLHFLNNDFTQNLSHILSPWQVCIPHLLSPEEHDFWVHLTPYFPRGCPTTPGIHDSEVSQTGKSNASLAFLQLLKQFFLVPLFLTSKRRNHLNMILSTASNGKDHFLGVITNVFIYPNAEMLTSNNKWNCRSVLKLWNALSPFQSWAFLIHFDYQYFFLFISTWE